MPLSYALSHTLFSYFIVFVSGFAQNKTEDIPPVGDRLTLHTISNLVHQSSVLFTLARNCHNRY